MKRSVILSATASFVIALIVGISFLMFSQDWDGLAEEAPRSQPRPDSEISPKEVMRDIDAGAESPVGDDIDPWKPDDSIFMTREQEIANYIASMSDEDKNLKPDGYDMSYWATFVKIHYEQLKQNGEIEFYGKVVAEDGLPLSGVCITVRISAFEPSLAKAIQRNRSMNLEDFDVFTDRKGRFSIKDKFGVSLGLSLFEIRGYRIIEGTTLGYNFSPEEGRAALGERHEADPANPVVFKMIKAEREPGYSLDDLD